MAAKKEEEEKAVTSIQKAGTKIVDLTPDEIQKFREATHPVLPQCLPEEERGTRAETCGSRQTGNCQSKVIESEWRSRMDFGSSTGSGKNRDGSCHESSEEIGSVSDFDRKGFVGMGIMITTILVFLAVITRYFFDFTPPWIEELTTYITLWIVFRGSGPLYKKDRARQCGYYLSYDSQKIRADINGNPFHLVGRFYRIFRLCLLCPCCQRQGHPSSKHLHGLATHVFRLPFCDYRFPAHDPGILQA